MLDIRPGKLHAALAAVAPIDGVAVRDWSDRATWTIAFRAEATEPQRAAAAAALAAFDAGVVRMALGADLFGVLSRTEHNALSAARADDLRIVTSRGQDEIPETNSKIIRLAAVLGISVSDWFDRL